MKADDKINLDGEDVEDITEFQYLKRKVEVLERVVDRLQMILRENNLHATKKIEADVAIEDEIWEGLDND